MNALALVLVALLAIPTHRAEQLATYTTDAAQIAQVDVGLLAALFYHESTYRASARSRAGAVGLGQLMPTTRWGRAYLRECEDARRIFQGDACELLQARHAAWALRDNIQKCGSHIRALGSYRTGRCRVGPRAYATVQLARQIRWRMANPSSRPLLAARLP